MEILKKRHERSCGRQGKKKRQKLGVALKSGRKDEGGCRTPGTATIDCIWEERECLGNKVSIEGRQKHQEGDKEKDEP